MLSFVIHGKVQQHFLENMSQGACPKTISPIVQKYGLLWDVRLLKIVLLRVVFCVCNLSLKVICILKLDYMLYVIIYYYIINVGFVPFVAGIDI